MPHHRHHRRHDIDRLPAPNHFVKHQVPGICYPACVFCVLCAVRSYRIIRSVSYLHVHILSPNTEYQVYDTPEYMLPGMTV